MPVDWHLTQLAHSYLLTGEYEEAMVTLQKVLNRNPDDLLAYISLAATYVHLGRKEEARAEATEVLRINPKFSLELFAKRLPDKRQSDKDRFIGGLRKAGLK